MNVTGNRFQLQRRMRAADPWMTICASDNQDTMTRLYVDQSKLVKEGGLRLWDSVIDRGIELFSKPDAPPRPARPTVAADDAAKRTA